VCIISHWRGIDRAWAKTGEIRGGAKINIVDILLVAIAWLLAGFALTWLVGGASRRDEPPGFDSRADDC
jgi:FlaG/FlaF family flagellin (archaellin)